MKWLAVLILLGMAVATSPAQTNNQCLIVKQNKGHRVRNVFLFGAYGLFSRGERFEYVESFNFDHWQVKYKGEELQLCRVRACIS